MRRPIAAVRETAGCGLEGTGSDGAVYRLGRSAWALPDSAQAGAGAPLTLSRDGRALTVFRFDDAVRDGAREAVTRLKASGLAIELLSGDEPEAVRSAADAVGVTAWRAGQLPADKVGRLADLARDGHRCLMVGDGLNDAPALAAAHVSMAPATAADIGRNAADFVFLRDSLLAVPQAFATAVRARLLVRQNLALAVLYNAIAVPIAVTGQVTPLVAAVAMSLSSLTVVANALRLRRDPGQPAASRWLPPLMPALRRAGARMA